MTDTHDRAREALAEIAEGIAHDGAWIAGCGPSAMADIIALVAEQDRRIAELEAENERLLYVLGGVHGAIKTGRNEPLMIWKDQIEIAIETARRALKGDDNG